MAAPRASEKAIVFPHIALVISFFLGMRKKEYQLVVEEKES